MHYKMSSAICFILDQSKVLSSGIGLNDWETFYFRGPHVILPPASPDVSLYLKSMPSNLSNVVLPEHWKGLYLELQEELKNGRINIQIET